MTGTPTHIVLVGLPGAGKSTAGPLLAQLLHVDFLDFDREIERQEGLTVAEIFARHGEAYFRGREHALTRDVAGRPPMVLAPGGGWITNPSNVAALRPVSRIIHLRVSVETAIRRLGSATADRPLLAGPAADARLRELAAARLPLYGSADEVIDTETLAPQQVAQIGLRLASEWGWPIG